MDDAPPPLGSGLTRRALMRGGLLAGLGAAGITVASSALIPGVAQASDILVRAGTDDNPAIEVDFDAQTNWGYCSKCKNLYYAPDNGVCAVSGSHAPASDTVYSVPDTLLTSGARSPQSMLQAPWQWCKRCGCLVWASGICRTSTGTYTVHDTSSSGTYIMLMGTWHSNNLHPLQQGWRYCVNCKDLYWGGQWANSWCNFQLYYGANSNNGQNGFGHAPGNTSYYLFMS